MPGPTTTWSSRSTSASSLPGFGPCSVAPGVDAPVITRGRLSLDPLRREVTADGRPVNLTTTEYNILELLMRRSPAVASRRTIAEHGWRDETDAMGSNAIDVQLSRLRAKLPSAGIRIVTVRGAGYRLEEVEG